MQPITPPATITDIITTNDPAEQPYFSHVAEFSKFSRTLTRGSLKLSSSSSSVDFWSVHETWSRAGEKRAQLLPSSKISTSFRLERKSQTDAPSIARSTEGQQQTPTIVHDDRVKPIPRSQTTKISIIV
ncbi:hypothetical protein T01_8540 [Trichinella spiralis]|uniref:Uncharacterized protein n=1 Tax=Trichinella spiralis TaxID=6334 RepID=A0A0V1B9H1_TRISP|nr:hypothetical protein T01_8540 [Trichinella spiralis]